MADSNITKRALSIALKNLLSEVSFDKISVGDICEKCDMRRKSFYYHFRDKYDLVNWIFDIEFWASVQKSGFDTGWHLLDDLCNYFYANKNFYRKILCIEGQNSFSDYFREIVLSILFSDLSDMDWEEGTGEFYMDFYADAFVCAIKKWIAHKDCYEPRRFVELLRRSLIGISEKIISNYKNT